MSESNALANGLAGAGGGIIAQILTYPLQTVNTRQQTERTLKRNKQSLLPQSSNTTTAPAPGILLQIFQVIGNEGWGGLYSGLKPSLLGTAASQGIYYFFYQVFKNKAVAIAAARKVKGRGDGTVGMFGWLIVAAIAGSFNVLLTNPIWVLVTRMQTHTQAERKLMDEKKEALRRTASESSLEGATLEDKLAELNSLKPQPFGTIHAANEVYSEAGIVGFWKGVIPALIMVCNPSIQFMIYESSLKHIREKRSAKNQGDKSVTALEVFLVGALAKLGATVCTYPLLVVKSRLQAKQEIGGSNSLRYSGTFDAILKMIRYEGFPGFYKGMSTKIVQSVFAASVLFMVKEELVKAFMVLADKSKKEYLISLYRRYASTYWLYTACGEGMKKSSPNHQIMVKINFACLYEPSSTRVAKCGSHWRIYIIGVPDLGNLSTSQCIHGAKINFCFLSNMTLLKIYK